MGVRWLGLALLAACSFHGPNASVLDAPPGTGPDAAGPPVDAGPPADAITTCAATDVVAGRFHTCARRADGYVWCWGGNSHGEAGTAPISDTVNCPVYPHACLRLPQHVAMPPVSALALGISDTCLIAGTATYCLGADDAQQFGDNAAGDAHAPRIVPLRASSSAIAIGDQHTCSISATRQDVECSGPNSYGEVGDNTGMVRGVPTAAMLTGTPTAIGVGYNHSCAIIASRVWCWGSNEQLQLSPSSSAVPFQFPIMVPGLTTATAVAGGDHHTCAVLADKTARCWGAGGYGQLGDGSFPNAAAQLDTVDLTDIVVIRPGLIHTCALTGSGGVYCWGSGFAAAAGGAGHPVRITLPAGAVSVAGGGEHDCAALVDGTVWCWGSNDHGQLGDGTTTSPATRGTAVKAKLCM